VGSALDRAASNQVYSFSRSAGEKPQCIEEEERSLQADKLVNGDRGLKTECTAKGSRLRTISKGEETKWRYTIRR
jgi:hypothetical protein